MASVKRTFTLPEEFSKEFDKLVPKQGRSEAVLIALESYIAQKRRERALEFLDNLKPMKNTSGLTAVELVRQARDELANRRYE